MSKECHAEPTSESFAAGGAVLSVSLHPVQHLFAGKNRPEIGRVHSLHVTVWQRRARQGRIE